MISTRGRYALRVMIDLAQHGGDAYVPLKDISERQQLSKKYLEILVRDLVKGKMIVGASINYNVEAENESTNDLRAGVEFAWLKNRWYVGAEAYLMHVGFTDRQKIDKTYTYWGGYAQLGYFVHKDIQLGLRYDLLDRNGTNKDGFLNMPAVSLNYFVPKTTLKLSAMYQFTGRWGHETQLDRDLDDLGIATHNACVKLQYAF